MSRWVYLVIFHGADVPDYEVYGRKASAEKAASVYNAEAERTDDADAQAVVQPMWVRPKYRAPADETPKEPKP